MKINVFFENMFGTCEIGKNNQIKKVLKKCENWKLCWEAVLPPFLPIFRYLNMFISNDWAGHLQQENLQINLKTKITRLLNSVQIYYKA